jgi:hypothetical protein
MMLRLKIYVILGHWRLLVDHNHVMNVHKLYFFVVVQDDKKRIEVLMIMYRLYHVLIYSMKNFSHISNTKIPWEMIREKKKIRIKLTRTILAFFNVLFCSITCLILSQFSTCHKRISQSLIIRKKCQNLLFIILHLILI